MIYRLRFLRGPCFLLIIITAVTVGTFIAINWYLADPLRRTSKSVDASWEENVDFRSDMALELQEIAREIKKLKEVKPKLLMKLNKLINEIDPRYALSVENIFSVSEETADACGEMFNGTLYGYPFYSTGFVESPTCKKEDKPALDKLVTIVLLDKTGELQILKDVIKGIKKYNSNIPIIFGSVATTKRVQDFKSQFHYVKGFDVDVEDIKRPGKMLNLMISSVKTPYLLFAKDIFHFNSLARLDRQIYVISSNNIVGIAGGAFRNESGYWKVGCYISQIRNYILKYTEGYQYSALDCMICDHLEGPFIAKTSVFTEIKFNEKLSSDVIFEDWFMRIKQQNIIAVACPDVMYFKKGLVEGVTDEEKSREHKSWLGLAREWQVDHIMYPSRVSIEFTCNELEVTCDIKRWSKAFFIPSCCITQVADALKALDEFSREKGTDYEIEAGTLLGAVKLKSFLPWDRDGDITFLLKDYNTFYDNSNFFSKKGFSLSMFKKGAYFRLNTPDIILEMWGSKEVSTFQLPSEMWEYPTMVKMIGVWVRGEWNPGLFVRNRYGPNYLKHVQHWSLLNMPDSWQTYKPGSWKSCPKKAHHACMDKYPTDGSIGLLPETLQ